MKRRTQAAGHRWTGHLQVEAGGRAPQKLCRWGFVAVSIPRQGGP